MEGEFDMEGEYDMEGMEGYMMDGEGELNEEQIRQLQEMHMMQQMAMEGEYGKYHFRHLILTSQVFGYLIFYLYKFCNDKKSMANLMWYR